MIAVAIACLIAGVSMDVLLSSSSTVNMAQRPAQMQHGRDLHASEQGEEVSMDADAEWTIESRERPRALDHRCGSEQLGPCAALVGVYSHPANFQRRALIRETWLKYRQVVTVCCHSGMIRSPRRNEVGKTPATT